MAAPRSQWPAATGALKMEKAKSVPMVRLPALQPLQQQFSGRGTGKRRAARQAVAVVPQVPAVSLADRKKWSPGGLAASCGGSGIPYTAAAVHDPA